MGNPILIYLKPNLNFHGNQFTMGKFVAPHGQAHWKPGLFSSPAGGRCGCVLDGRSRFDHPALAMGYVMDHGQSLGTEARLGIKLVYIYIYCILYYVYIYTVYYMYIYMYTLYTYCIYIYCIHTVYIYILYI